MNTLQTTAQIRAIQFGESLMPSDCMDILIDVYGNTRLENMLPSTIVKKLVRMMCTVSDEDDVMIEYCEFAANSWLNDFS